MTPGRWGPQGVLSALTAFGWALAACTQQVSLPMPAPEAIVDAADDRSASGDLKATAPATAPRDGSSAETWSAPSEACRSIAVYSRAIPLSAQVLLVVDRSLSMFMPRKDGTTRNEMMYAALIPLLQNYRYGVNFGYHEFPSSSSTCQTGCCTGLLYPPGPTAVGVIERALRCESGGEACFRRSDDSPSAAALRRCADFYEQNESSTVARYALLLTDAEPSCTADPTGSTSDPCQGALAEVARLARSRVKTIVFGLAEELQSSGCLETLAQYGDWPRTGSTAHFLAFDQTQLRTQLQEIFEKLSFDACRFRVGNISSSALSLVAHDKAIGRYYSLRHDPTHQQGWDFEAGSTSRVQVYGTWCDRLRKADVDVLVGSCR
jgi:hypothetical protein